MFVGRDYELARLTQWVSDDKNRAGVLVGNVGCGKTELLKAFKHQYAESDATKSQWYVQSLDVTGDQQVDGVMEHLLGQMYNTYSGIVKTGPGDRNRVQALLQSVPGIGKLLATFVEQDTRYGWERFLVFVKELSRAAVQKQGPDTRLIFLIDPQPELKLAASGAWIPLAEGLPDAVRLIIAQRPDDTLARDGEARRFFSRVLESPLGDLSKSEVEQWYKQEIVEGYLKDFDNSLHNRIWRTAHGRYAGYPLAHDAVMKVLANDKPDPDALHDAITHMPRELHDLVDLLYDKLRALGEDQHRAGLTLCIFASPTPQDVWAKASNMNPVAFSRMLGDDRFACLFKRVETRFGESFLPYHQLFTERLERELQNGAVRKNIADAAWSTIAPQLSDEAMNRCNAPFFALAAASSVAKRADKPDRFLEVISKTVSPKIRLGLLDEATADLRVLFTVFGSNEEVAAIGHTNLGHIMYIRGNLHGAEQEMRTALAIYRKQDRREGIAENYSNLGVILSTRGDLDGAEEVLRKALEINEELGQPEKSAIIYGNLGLVVKTRGDLQGAEKMYREALAINKKFGQCENLANDYGNLGGVMYVRGELQTAEEMYCKSLAINKEFGRLEGMAKDYENLSSVRGIVNDMHGAERMCRKSLAINDELGCLQGMASNYCKLGNILGAQGNPEDAEQIYREALAIDQKLDRPEGIADDYAGLGIVLSAQGDLEGAENTHRASLEINKELGRLDGMADNYGNLGIIMKNRGDLDCAEEMQYEALAINEKLGRLEGMARDYSNLGTIMATRYDPDKARAMWGRARDLFAQIGAQQQRISVLHLMDNL